MGWNDDGVKNAIIQSAVLSFEDRGFLDCWITLDYGGSGQGFGGYTLYLPKSWTLHSMMSPAGHFIFRVMEVAGVTGWHLLPGKTVRARIENGFIVALGHIVKDDWFCPKDDFATLDKEPHDAK